MTADPSSADNYPQEALPIGTRLGEFEVRGVLGIGGFGIVYEVFDHQLERKVAIKEYMPSSLAGRTATFHVTLLSQSNSDTFHLGLKSFINEARLLARFDHPSLVKVYRYWQENSTAYMSMPLYLGRTVKVVRLQMQSPPDEAWVRSVLEPLLGAIEKLHQEDIYHRDIAPDNILIEADGRPVLLDFGAARRVISDKTQDLTAILKPAYAPIEQYGESTSLRQGPWTDIYSLGATMRFLLLGRPPMQATMRAMVDDLPPLAGMSLPGVSPAFLQLIDWMLAPRPAERPQNVAAVRKVMAGEMSPPAANFPTTQTLPVSWDRTLPMTSGVTRNVGTEDRLAQQEKAIFEPLAPTAGTDNDARARGRAQAEDPPPAASGMPKWIPAAGVGVLALAAAAWFGLAGKQSTSAGPAVRAPETIASAPVVVPARPPEVAVTPTVGTTVSASTPPPADVASSAPAGAALVVAPTTAASKPVAARPLPPPVARNAAPSVKAGPRPTETNEPPAAQKPPVNVAAEPAPAALPAPARPTPPPAADVAKSTHDADTPLSPSESCRKQIFALKWVCMDVQCGKARYQQHPECLQLRADQERARSGTR